MPLQTILLLFVLGSRLKIDFITILWHKSLRYAVNRTRLSIKKACPFQQRFRAYLKTV